MHTSCAERQVDSQILIHANTLSQAPSSSIGCRRSPDFPLDIIRCHLKSCRRFATYSLLALCVALLWAPPVAPGEESPEVTLQPWAAANLAWLERQVTPNRVVPGPDPTRRRLLVSYDLAADKFPRTYHRSATYDNALAALAFLITGESDRAAFILHALARLVRPDGSLWASYNTANNWPDESDHDGALIRAGSIGWAGYAFTFYLAHGPLCASNRGCERERAFFLDTAARLANYLLTLQVNDADDPRDGLLRLGYGTVVLEYRDDTNDVAELYRNEPASGISTENNVSAWFFLRRLGELTGESRWSRAAERIAGGLVRAAWNDAIGQFNEGFGSEGAPERSKALDCASWGALFLLAAGQTEKARRAVGVIEGNYAAGDREAQGYRPYSDQPIYADPRVGRFFFPNNPRKEWRDLPLVWSEGSLGVALAYLRMGQPDRARRIVAGLRALQVKNSGLRYASMEVPHQMARAPSVAASAWLVLVAEALAGNALAEQVWK